MTTIGHAQQESSMQAIAAFVATLTDPTYLTVLRNGPGDYWCIYVS